MVLEKKIYALENRRELLMFKTRDGIPLYLISKKFLSYDYLMPKIMGLDFPQAQRRFSNSAIQYITKAWIKNIENKKIFKEASIVFYSPNRPTVCDGKYVNRYTDLLAEQYFDQAITIEGSPLNWNWPYPRWNERVLFDVPRIVCAKIKENFLSKFDKDVVHSYLQFYSRLLKEILDFSLEKSEFEIIKKRVFFEIVKSRAISSWFDSILPDNIKGFIMVGACYPSSYLITRTLKERGILVADIQHGCITKTNPIYSYPQEINESKEVKDGSADYFLTYGKWWNNQIINPATKVTLGNPYREYCLKSINKRKQKRVLVIGSGINTKKIMNITSELTDILSNYEVAFRPHPLEVRSAQLIMNKYKFKIKIDPVIEVYESLSSSSIVVSEVSTVLFDAIGLCDKVIVIDTEYSRFFLPDNPFYKCSNINEIIDLIGDDIKSKDSHIIDEVWAKGWKGNFKRFMENIILNKESGELQC